MVANDQRRPRLPTSAVSDPLAGTRYRTLESLGGGGMGEVVLAEHIGLGKRVVVKLLHKHFADDPALGRRMQIEARSLAALTSPHIVQVIDFGQSVQGRTYIVMERLIGRTLAAEIQERGALPFLEAIDYVVQVLAGLEAAHAMGIIHRDIKPDNIFLCDATRESPRIIKILDFGVAKILSVATEIGRPAFPHVVTTEGEVVGTPRVIAPEQARGKPVDARTDVYATGLLLYSLVVGRGPFAHLRNPLDLLKANATVLPVPPSQMASQHLPPGLDAAILRALEKLPEHRFQSTGDFANELRRVLAGMSSAALPPALVASPAPETQEVERTLQLVAGTSGLEDGSATFDPPSDSGALHSSAKTSSEALAQAEAAPPAAPVRRPTGWGKFLTLALLSAAISTIALATLYRIMGP